MKHVKRIVIALLILTVIAAVGGGYLVNRMLLIPSGKIHEPIVVVVKEGDTLSKTAGILKEKGVILDERLFVTAARYLGAEKMIRTGEYEIKPDMSPKDVLIMLMKGRVIEYPVTVPEGLNVYQVADLLAKKGFVDREVFLGLVYDRQFIESLGIDASTLEGYLFPDTYRVNKTMREPDIIMLMVDRCIDVFNEEKKKASPEGIGDYERLILASIIEKETSAPEERPLVSAVFLNRINKGMKLDSCATVIYGIWDRFDGNLRESDLSTWTPYNTYMNPGFPPGPICNPGRDSIAAALGPADVDYLYFVSKNDGTSYFSSTLSEHNRAVYEYQILGKNRK